MTKFEVKSPTRVDLAGGTLDMWPLFAFLGGATTINLSISIYTRATLEISAKESSQAVRIESKDLKKIWQFPDLASFRAATDLHLRLYQLVEEQVSLTWGFSLTTQSDSPVGGGLGGSSSLMISLLRVFMQARGGQDLPTLELMHLAHNLEAQLLRTPTGTQDYIPAIVPGLNLIQYSCSGVGLVTKAKLPPDFADRFLLVYTGRSHHSGLNNFEVLKAAVSGDQEVLRALAGIGQVAQKLRRIIDLEDWSRLPDIFAEELKFRLQLTPHFSSPEIETLIAYGAAQGQFSVKICGAGGGGCVLLWLRNSGDRAAVEAWLRENSMTPLNAEPVLA